MTELATSADTQPRLAGRDEALDQVCRAATTPGRSLVVVTGPAGIGRSSVLDRARARLTTQGVRTITVPVLPSERDRPHALTSRICDELDAPSDPDAHQRLTTTLQQHTTPLVVILDDLQWADPDSLRALSRQPASAVTFVCAHHTTTTQTLPPLPSVELVRLHPLQPHETSLMIAGLLQAKPTPAMIDTLQHGSAGIPAIIRLAIDGYRRAGSLRIVDRTAYLVPSTQPPTPAPRHPGFDSLRRLGSTAWPVLKALAVLHPLGDHAPALIAAATGNTEIDVEHILTGLEADELLYARPWRFRTPLLATCLTSCLGPYERHELARLAVTALWDGTATCEDPRFLPEQLVNAGTLIDPDRAGTTLLEHGTAAIVDDEYFAIRWLEAAAERVTDPQQRANALFLHAVACGYHADFTAANDSINTVITSYTDRLSPEAVQETQIVRLIGLGATGDRRTLHEIADYRYHALLGDDADQIIGRAFALCFIDRWAEAETLLDTTRHIWSHGNDSAVTYGNVIAFGTALVRGRPSTYFDLVDDIEGHCPLFAEQRHQPGLLNAMARALLLIGEATRADQLMAAHNLAPEHTMTATRALQASAVGHWDDALTLARLSLATGSTLGHLLCHTVLCREMATILTARGTINAARDMIDSARIAETCLPHLLALAEADLEHALGNHSRARLLLDDGLSTAEEQGIVVGTDELWLRIAVHNLTAGAHADASDAVTELKQLAERLGTGRARRNHLLATALVHDDYTAAGEAIATARNRGQTPEIADTLMHLLQHTMGTPALMREAYDLYGDMDALLPRAKLRRLMRDQGIAVPGRSVTNSENERLLASLVADGLTNRELATVLATTEKNVEARLSRLFQRTGYRTRVELATAILTGEYHPA
ncbi:AAA family ATPase [Kibdelosporangium aridum]|uniref:Regulatory protein, luxR family n=1 Tax=Kibdelosporangium aridum TaxID=2030 RepID=A0A1Y5X4P4_KIBAR|nr:LuxR family transcriptional regulator [Kibdelosporangium aridum]SMC70660.1 regulatory protein, luxR family [Kibdelosporangium aridum]